MGRPSSARSLVAWFNGVQVGTWRMQKYAEPSFTYAPAWFDSAAFRSLSLSLPAVRNNPVLSGPAVTHYFDNLLPDSDAIRRRLQARFAASDTGAFALLTAVGRDCAGAVQLLPPDETPHGIDRIDAVPLDDAAVERLLQHVTAAPNGLVPQDGDDLRLSIAGAQEKTALLWHAGRWCRPLGATPTTHIFKLPLGLVGNRRADMRTSVENEWLCAQILRAYQLPVAAADMARFGQTKVLIVERFDRMLARDGRHWLRLPQEDFCQATGTPAMKKYEAEGGPGILPIAAILGNSAARDQDIRAFLKSQVIFWMLRATDGHAKNFSLFLLPGDRYRMTPLYDVLSAWPVIGAAAALIPAQRVTMAMQWHGKNAHYHAEEILARHMRQTMRKCGLGEAPDVLLAEIIEATDGVVRTIEAALPPGFPEHVAASILRGLEASASRLRAGVSTTC